MMTKAEALYAFFNQVMQSYPSAAVPDSVDYPYLTYDLATGSFGDVDTNITVNIWDYTDSEAEINALARKVGEAIPRGGVMVRCEGGAMWLKRGTPWMQAVVNEDNRTVKRRYLNVSAEFITND
jgi:hypothetical protein